MSDLLWPGDHRAGRQLSDSAILEAMVMVEQAWLDALTSAGRANSSDLSGVVTDDDIEALSLSAENIGNPVSGLVSLLRERTGNPWIHRGLTSQDVLDSALLICLHDVRQQLLNDLQRQAELLIALCKDHRDSLMAGRTLTQHAVPVTFGLKAASWLNGVIDALQAVRAFQLPAQFGGAAGTQAAMVEVAGSPERAQELIDTAISRLPLSPTDPWHVRRTTVTVIGDALATCTQAWGHLAADVAVGSRPEVGELSEGTPGGSSTMPHKQNPVLSTLLRRAAIAVPPLASTLHLSAGLMVDERPSGAWHVEWATLRDLARRTLIAASQATELLQGLQVDVDRMRETAQADWQALTAEQRSLAEYRPDDAACVDESYLGANDALTSRAIQRARDCLRTEDRPPEPSAPTSNSTQAPNTQAPNTGPIDNGSTDDASTVSSKDASTKDASA